MSQRTLEDTFNSNGFKALFGLGEDEKVRRSSISERLSKIEVNYFREIYEQMYGRFSELYDKSEIEKYNLIRVDSTIVADTCSKLKEGIDQKSGKKLVKFSFLLMVFYLLVLKFLPLKNILPKNRHFPKQF